MTAVSPSTSSTTYGVRNSIFGFARARLTMICEARNSSRRWTSVTFVPKRVRKSASSKAESPPPTTTIGFSLKNAPSQVAQAETPRPCRRCSDSSPSQRALAPVATITACARYSSRSTQTRNGRSEKSTFVTSSVIELGAEALGLAAEVLPSSRAP